MPFIELIGLHSHNFHSNRMPQDPGDDGTKFLSILRVNEFTAEVRCTTSFKKREYNRTNLDD